VNQRQAKRLVGLVISDRMDKTIVVLVSHRVRNREYHKYVTRRVKYKVHDERSEAKSGDRVQIVECRPLSREKRWRLSRVAVKSQTL
jgi:small subunit ribosomal protein S17